MVSLVGRSPDQYLAQMAFDRSPYLPQEGSRILSGLSSDTVSVISDSMALYRQGVDMGETVWTPFPQSLLSTKGAKIAYQGFGLSSSMNVLIGLVGLRDATQELGRAQAIFDGRGTLYGRISQASSLSRAGAGVSFALFRPFSMLKIAGKLSSSPLTGRLLPGFLFSGLSFYNLFFALYTFMCGIKLYDGIKMKRALKGAPNLLAQLEHLQEARSVCPQVIYNKMVAKVGSKKAADDRLVKEALKNAEKKVAKLAKECGSQTSAQRAVGGLLPHLSTFWSFSSRQTQIRNHLIQMGLEIRAEKRRLKNRATAERLFGKEGANALKSVESLVARVQRGDLVAIREAQRLVDGLEKTLNKGLTETGALLALMILGTISVNLVMGSADLVVTSTVMLAFGLAMTGYDLYCLAKSFKSDTPGRHDGKMLALSSLLALGSLASVIGLSALRLSTLNTFPAILSFSLTGIWLGQNGVAYAVSRRNGRTYDENNPTLASLGKALNGGGSRDVLKMADRLPEHDRNLVAKEMRATRNLAIAVQRVQQRQSLAQERQKAFFRRALEVHSNS